MEGGSLVLFSEAVAMEFNLGISDGVIFGGSWEGMEFKFVLLVSGSCAALVLRLGR